MNFNDRQAFVAVAEHGSFSIAAQTLHITQPAVTKRIANLEDVYDTRLFDRIGRRVVLTRAGELLLPNAKALLNAAQDTQRQLQNLSAQVSGTLSIATSHHIGLHRLAPVLREFRTTYPDVALNLTFEDSEVAHQMVRQGDVELAVVTLDPAGEVDLHTELIWSDPLVFVSDQKLQKVVSLAALAERPCVLPGMATYTGRIVTDRFSDAGLTLQPVMSTNYLETIGMLVSVGLGWSVLPATMQAELQVLKVDTPPLTRNLGMVSNPQRVMSRAASAFIEVLQTFN